MPEISFVHFDTSLRDDLTDDPFHCSLILSNPIRNIKKIYLKSCEIPWAFLISEVLVILYSQCFIVICQNP